jgi:hypothetical protein
MGTFYFYLFILKKSSWMIFWNIQRNSKGLEQKEKKNELFMSCMDSMTQLLMQQLDPTCFKKKKS